MRSIRACASATRMRLLGSGAAAILLTITPRRTGPLVIGQAGAIYSTGYNARSIPVGGQGSERGRSLNETRHQLATNLFSRPHRCSEATDVEALAHALQFEQRLADALHAPANLQRKRIWDLRGTLHCSIIGTCLSTGELRQLLIKLQVPGAAKATDHDLHGQAVAMASNRGGNSKQLHKALDRRH